MPSVFRSFLKYSVGTDGSSATSLSTQKTFFASFVEIVARKSSTGHLPVDVLKKVMLRIKHVNKYVNDLQAQKVSGFKHLDGLKKTGALCRRYIIRFLGQG
jgi:hypothetical protein